MTLYRNPRQKRYIPPNRRPLTRLWRTFLTGLVATIPIGVTAYLIYWLFSAADAMFRGFGAVFLPAGWHFPGMGLIAGVLTVLAVGAILNTWVFGQVLLSVSSRVLERIPLIKTVYGGVRDLMLFVSRPPEGDTRNVVLVTLPGDLRLIGFVTDPAPTQAVPELNVEGEAVLAVYLPLSYQIGGYTLYLPERCLQRLEMPVEEAMRMVLTAGMNRPGKVDPTAQLEVT